MLHLEETTETLEWLTETEALVGERKEKVTSQEFKRSGLPSRWPVCRKQEDEKDRSRDQRGQKDSDKLWQLPVPAGLSCPYSWSG